VVVALAQETLRLDRPDDLALLVVWSDGEGVFRDKP